MMVYRNQLIPPWNENSPQYIQARMPLTECKNKAYSVEGLTSSAALMDLKPHLNDFEMWLGHFNITNITKGINLFQEFV